MRGHKLNMACRCAPDSDVVGVGILIRDSMGRVAAALETTVVGCGDMVQVHATAIGTALQFAFDIGLRNLVVEVCCQELLRLIQMGTPCGASCGVLVDDICWWIPLFNALSFSFIPKLCNKATVALAAEALSSGSIQVWLDDQLNCVTSFVQVDLAQ